MADNGTSSLRNRYGSLKATDPVRTALPDKGRAADRCHPCRAGPPGALRRRRRAVMSPSGSGLGVHRRRRCSPTPRLPPTTAPPIRHVRLLRMSGAVSCAVSETRTAAAPCSTCWTRWRSRTVGGRSGLAGQNAVATGAACYPATAPYPVGVGNRGRPRRGPEARARGSAAAAGFTRDACRTTAAKVAGGRGDPADWRVGIVATPKQ